MPDWFLIARAARYWRVAPWDLITESSAWRDIATTLQTEEAKAEKQRNKRSSRKHGKRH